MVSGILGLWESEQHVPESHCESIQSTAQHHSLQWCPTCPLLWWEQLILDLYLTPTDALCHWALNECRAAIKVGHYHLPNTLSCLNVLIKVCETGDSAEKSINLTRITSLKGRVNCRIHFSLLVGGGADQSTASQLSWARVGCQSRAGQSLILQNHRNFCAVRISLVTNQSQSLEHHFELKTLRMLE